MFTGIVEETGRVVDLSRGGARLKIGASLVTHGTTTGDSISVNGCCLTVVERTPTTLAFDLLEETLARTNLGALRTDSPVNLERALAATGRLGGHFVQGHVDCAANVLAHDEPGNGGDHRLEIFLPDDFARYVVFKGAIAIDGVSLTVSEVHSSSFVVWLIPHTIGVTNLRMVQAGERVNLEFDLLAKYVEKLVAPQR